MPFPEENVLIRKAAIHGTVIVRVQLGGSLPEGKDKEWQSWVGPLESSSCLPLPSSRWGVGDSKKAFWAHAQSRWPSFYLSYFPKALSVLVSASAAPQH